MPFLVCILNQTPPLFLFFNADISGDSILDEVPPQSRATLAPLLSLVRGSRSRTMPHKASGELLSRQHHFLKFLSSVNLNDNVTLLGFSTLTRNAIMGCYAATLVSGHTIQCKSIHVSTISKNLSTAAAFSIPFQAMNPLVNIYGEKSRLVEDIKNEAKRWEPMPNRRGPLTKDMVRFLIKKATALNLFDGLYVVMTD